MSAALPPRQRILCLTHRIPYPPNKGEKIRAYHILRELAGRHEVTLATLVDDAADMAGVPVLQKLVHRVEAVRIDQPGRGLLAARAFLTGGSLSVAHFYSPELQRRVTRLLTGGAFDAVFCSSSPMAEYVFRAQAKAGPGLRRFMDLIDIDSLKWTQYARRNPPWKAWLYRYEAWALGRYEQRIARSFDRLYVVSEQEGALFPGGAPASLVAMPNGVDLEAFSASAVQPHTFPRPTMVFTGVMDYWPNVEGVTWFVQQVLPRIQRAVPDAAFCIVGARPVAAICQLATLPGVSVTGFVQDVRSYVAGAALCVAPLRIARGVQNKVLEAMAMGKAVVTTTQAHEGLRAQAGRDVVVADGEQAFADAVIALLRDPVRAADVGLQARRCVEVGYAWSTHLARLQEDGL